MSKKSELKQNILASKLEGVAEWVLPNRSKIYIGAGVALGALLISSVYIIRTRETEDLNWTRITQAQSYAEQAKGVEARQILTEVQSSAPNANSGLYATYHLGELSLKEKKYDEAAQYFSDTLARAGNNPVKPLALSNLAFVYEEKGEFAQAAQTYQQFLDGNAEHFLAPRIQLMLGRAWLLAGNQEASKKSLGQLIDLYPTSHWADLARRFMDKIETR